MKPIAIFRHARSEGPGYFATFLNEHAIPWVMIRIDEGDAVPADASAFSGLVFMGGPMSVNDDLPWIPKVLALIRDAYAKDIPLLGHCLGGQLMSKALGGVVSKNPVKEIGWGKVDVSRQRHCTRSGSATSVRSSPSTGTARLSVCRKARCICSPARTVRTRLMPSANIWRCNAMSK